MFLKPKLFASSSSNKTANVFLNQASGFYDKSAKAGERMTLLEGSILEKPDPSGWIYRDLEILANQGHVERIGAKYKVIKPITGSTSGTAAAVLGVGFKPAGYQQWKFGNGQSIYDAGEK
ncbi:hypothetical protein [Brevibacillus brevis]|uniref:hypothetical protein n=1 Tax=Brevibacillus brevis TaxID=1393 RepID=UPI000D11193A|nr:hypothetical protein [Brevibacillus brevis]PSJ63539.1 hypothetical protein C7J99_31265 [Brevibacillus brevis]RED33854.1 hypothetical protein DES34_10219 [Brevibacillus brevis]GEC93345.1 hypothetical protein BBR01nite_56760 [Brevibacillus brevis]VEF92576.1 Uncharacterised protein [Brevibacillus brevis]